MLFANFNVRLYAFNFQPRSFTMPKLSRREALHLISQVVGSSLFFPGCLPVKTESRLKKNTKNPSSIVYRSVNGTPVQNMDRVLMLMGGIETIIGPDDIVCIKPNLQWWNQGAPNIAAVNYLIEMIFNRPGGFGGEVILAENNHRGNRPWEMGGWAQTFVRNSDCECIHYNALVHRLKHRFGDRFTASHLIDIKAGGRRVYSPSDGPGYVYCDGTGGNPLLKIDNFQSGDQKRETIMSYPILKTDRGTIIDFKKGIWEKNAYSSRPFRFINFAAINHHSFYCGATASIKNYMGIVDLSGGPDNHKDGRMIGDYYNFHTFPFDHWDEGPVRGIVGYAIGYFMHSIRTADLNFITAHWCGLASRTETPVAEAKTIMASRNPVALDYHASKYVLYPNSTIPFHNPDKTHLPLFQYMAMCAKQTGFGLDEKHTRVESFDFKNNTMQEIENLQVKGEKIWGNNYKSLLKHFLLHIIKKG
ncbi:MAG: DUF362 domain-containing protein [Chitinivibrionales bacterium]|nr:DUF362 domain-containing protein [Chitinivibrionales bacterium]